MPSWQLKNAQLSINAIYGLMAEWGYDHETKELFETTNNECPF
jgi:hypothetical protein